MEGAREFQDWELLHSSETDSPDPFHASKEFLDIEGVSEGVVRSDYFASDSQQNIVAAADHVDSSGDDGSVNSDNPSWIEPCDDSRYVDDSKNEFHHKHSSEFWTDSSGDESGSCKFTNFDGKEDLGIDDYVQREVGFEGIGQISEFDGGNENLKEKETGVVGVGGEELEESAEYVEGSRGGIVANPDGEGEKKGMVWWKVPFEILKFCLFKVNPGWSIAVAAAVMGIVILRRRLYKMKKKSRSIPLEITVEDKKVSQFLKNVARVNEAFSVVRRAPVVRPLLPTGLTPWPVVNLR